MKDFNHTLQIHLFWFCVGVFTLSFVAMMALLFVHVPEANREMASNAQGFLQGSLMTSALGFLLTGSLSPSAKKHIDTQPGTTSIDIQATATTAPESKPDVINQTT